MGAGRGLTERYWQPQSLWNYTMKQSKMFKCKKQNSVYAKNVRNQAIPSNIHLAYVGEPSALSNSCCNNTA